MPDVQELRCMILSRAENRRFEADLQLAQDALKGEALHAGAAQALIKLLQHADLACQLTLAALHATPLCL